MANTLIDNTTNTLTANSPRLWGPYWSDKNTGVVLFVDSGSDLAIRRTTDAGATWGVKSIIENGSTPSMAVWFDKETPNNTGNLLHVGWVDAAGTTALKYVTINVATSVVGTVKVIDTSVTISSNPASSRVAITKTVNGNLLIAAVTQVEVIMYRSVDAGVNWVSKLSPYETAAEEDWCIMFAANTADNADACCIYLDKSASILSIKMYDDSLNTWTETTIATSIIADFNHIAMDASIRHSDGHIILAAHTNEDSTGDDFRVWDINPNSISTPSITTKTNIYTNQAESSQASVLINQMNDDIYVAYLKGGTWEGAVNAVFHKSSNGGASWGGEQAYSEGGTADLLLISGGRSVGASEGRVQWSFFNDGLKDIYTNLINDIELISALNLKININDVWKDVVAVKQNIGGVWKNVVAIKQNIGGVWKTVL